MNVKSTKRLILIKGLGVMVFNATFNNISVISRSVLLVEKTEYPEKNHKPTARHRQTLSHNVVLSTPHHEWDSVVTA
jgi:hypothetical protein